MVLPDQRFPHRLAEPLEGAMLWCGLPDGTVAKCGPYRLEVDWWVASPRVLEDPLP
jgi:hypothetical protein